MWFLHVNGSPHSAHTPPWLSFDVERKRIRDGMDLLLCVSLARMDFPEPLWGYLSGLAPVPSAAPHRASYVWFPSALCSNDGSPVLDLFQKFAYISHLLVASSPSLSWDRFISFWNSKTLFPQDHGKDGRQVGILGSPSRTLKRLSNFSFFQFCFCASDLLHLPAAWCP